MRSKIRAAVAALGMVSSLAAGTVALTTPAAQADLAWANPAECVGHPNGTPNPIKTCTKATVLRDGVRGGGTLYKVRIGMAASQVANGRCYSGLISAGGYSRDNRIVLLGNGGQVLWQRSDVFIPGWENGHKCSTTITLSVPKSWRWGGTMYAWDVARLDAWGDTKKTVQFSLD